MWEELSHILKDMACGDMDEEFKLFILELAQAIDEGRVQIIPRAR